jgi:hypothetical protein
MGRGEGFPPRGFGPRDPERELIEPAFDAEAEEA